MVDQQPTKYTAVIINTPGLIVTLPDGKDLAERKKAIQARTKVPLSFIVAVQSRAEQEHLQKQLANELMKPHAPNVTPVVVGVGSDSRGAVTVILHEDLDDSDTVGLRQSLKERYGVGVVFGKSGIPRAGPG
jgi:hypothetical protein